MTVLFFTIASRQTAVGARYLRQQLLRPSADAATIKARQCAAQYFTDNDEVLTTVVEHLKRVPDTDVMLNRLVGMQEGKRDARVVGGNIKTIIMLKQIMQVLMEIASVLRPDDVPSGANTNNVAGRQEKEGMDDDQNDDDKEGGDVLRHQVHGATFAADGGAKLTTIFVIHCSIARNSSMLWQRICFLLAHQILWIGYSPYLRRAPTSRDQR